MTTHALDSVIQNLNQNISKVDVRFSRRNSILGALKHFLILAPARSYMVRELNSMHADLDLQMSLLDTLLSAVNSKDHKDETIDPDMVLNKSLDNTKGKLLYIAETAKNMAKAHNQSSKVYAALMRINHKAKESWAVANDLQWAMGEHDVPLLGRFDAKAATTDEELAEMLSKLTHA